MEYLMPRVLFMGTKTKKKRKKVKIKMVIKSKL